MYNYEKFCHLIFSGSHRRHAYVEFKHLDNLYRKQQLPLSSKPNCLFGLQMKNHCEESVGFSFRAALCFPP